MSTTSTLKFNTTLFLDDVKLRLDNVLHKHLVAHLSVVHSDVRVVSEVLASNSNTLLRFYGLLVVKGV